MLYGDYVSLTVNCNVQASPFRRNLTTRLAFRSPGLSKGSSLDANQGYSSLVQLVRPSLEV